MRFRPEMLVPGVLAAGLFVRLVRLVMNGPLWGDEAMLVRSLLDRTPAEFFQPLDYAQLSPPAFLWIEWACSRWLGTAEWVWRLPPAVAGCAALWLFARLALRVLPFHAAGLAIGILSSSVYMVRHTVEAKPYIVDFGIALLLLHLGRGIQHDARRPERWLWFALVSMAAVWCSFPGVFAAGGVLAGVLISLAPGLKSRSGDIPADYRGALTASPPTFSDRQFLTGIVPAWLACGAGLTASFVAMYVFYGRVQMRVADEAGYWQMSMWDVAYPPWQQPHLFVWWLIREHTGTMLAHPFGGKNFASLLTAVCVAAGVCTLCQRSVQSRKRLLLPLLLAPAVLGLIAACLKKYPYGGTARTMLYLAPAIGLLAGAGAWSLMVRWLSPRARRRAWTGAMLGCLGLIAGKLCLEVACPWKEHGDQVVRQTVRTWLAEAGPDDVWIIANATATPARSDRGLYGGVSIAVFDHYLLTEARVRVLRPRQVIDFPETPGRVVVLVHESLAQPLPVDIAAIYRERFTGQATFLTEDAVDLERTEILRRMIFTRPAPR